jgi:hypothetical protein
MTPDDDARRVSIGAMPVNQARYCWHIPCRFVRRPRLATHRIVTVWAMAGAAWRCQHGTARALSEKTPDADRRLAVLSMVTGMIFPSWAKSGVGMGHPGTRSRQTVAIVACSTGRQGFQGRRRPRHRAGKLICGFWP